MKAAVVRCISRLQPLRCTHRANSGHGEAFMKRPSTLSKAALGMAVGVLLAGLPLSDAATATLTEKSGVADRLYRIDCGHSLANDESVWTPGENIGRNIEFSCTCWLIKHGSEWVLLDIGVP